MSTVSAAFVLFNQFRQDLGRGVHNLETDTIKWYLSNDAPVVATDAVKADVTEISTGNGYPGPVDAACSYSQAGGVGTLSGSGTTITASGAIGPFQYVVFYNDTPAGDPLIGYMPWPGAISLSNQETFAPSFTSIFTLT